MPNAAVGAAALTATSPLASRLYAKQFNLFVGTPSSRQCPCLIFRYNSPINYANKPIGFSYLCNYCDIL
jgi:hypothetical protein